MRVRTFHAKTMRDAMQQVREDLGDDAIIIQSDEGKNGVRIVAAIEGDTASGVRAATQEKSVEQRETPVSVEAAYKAPVTAEYDTADVRAVLGYHSLPFETAERLGQAALAVESASLSGAFSSALDTMLRFNPLTDAHKRPLMLVGPPGAGKTVCAAKLTADALMHNRTVNLISTDTVKAAGVHQLDHFAQLMKQSVITAASPHELAAVISKNPSAELTLIDTQGANAFDMKELKSLLAYIREVDAEPVLVMPAGLDAYDAQDMADVFLKLGCKRFIATRLDAARRYAGIVMAARPGLLSLAAISRSPYIADGLEAASPMGFARLLTALPKARQKTKVELDTRND